MGRRHCFASRLTPDYLPPSVTDDAGLRTTYFYASDWHTDKNPVHKSERIKGSRIKERGRLEKLNSLKKSERNCLSLSSSICVSAFQFFSSKFFLKLGRSQISKK